MKRVSTVSLAVTLAVAFAGVPAWATHSHMAVSNDPDCIGKSVAWMIEHHGSLQAATEAHKGFTGGTVQGLLQLIVKKCAEHKGPPKP